MKRVLIMDTSILCVWLKVPHFDRCGPKDDEWDFARVDRQIEKEIKARATLVLPLAAIIETGNHIAKSAKRRFECASTLMGVVLKAVDGSSPWAAFTDQTVLWERTELGNLAIEWPKQADAKVSIADASISRVADYYQRAGVTVEILTGDKGLKALEPARDTLIPRRRQR